MTDRIELPAGPVVKAVAAAPALDDPIGTYDTNLYRGAPSGYPILTTDNALKVMSVATGSRPAASSVPAAMIFDVTLGIPIWSNGANWVNATGTIV